MSWICAVKAATAASCFSFSGEAALPQFENLCANQAVSRVHEVDAKIQKAPWHFD
jgi:hypothetical protein